MSEKTRLDEDFLRSKATGFYNQSAKRVLSIFLAVPITIALSPLFVVIALAIIIDSGLPVFYRGERAGYQGLTFRIFKFRTMVRNAIDLGGGTTALRDPRITRVGSFLRSTKLDETPQLLNVLRGEMCFVGPRPELLEYAERYQGLERYILEVRPGITDISSLEFIDLASVVGTADADGVYEQQVLPRKNALRLEYVAKMSLPTDARIFALTAARTLQQAINALLGRR